MANPRYPEKYLMNNLLSEIQLQTVLEKDLKVMPSSRSYRNFQCRSLMCVGTSVLVHVSPCVSLCS